MHSDQPHYPVKSLNDQVGYYMQNAPVASVLNGFSPPIPLCNVDIHPSEACPRNFMIFDQTINRSQIMFNPQINSKMLNHPSFGLDPSLFQLNLDQHKGANEDGKISSPFKEDSADIDALLSLEYEESNDEMSTARTSSIYDRSSPDSCSSNYESVSRKTRSLFRKYSVSRVNEKRRLKIRKTVKALQGIVPGANRMSTVAVLDEAIGYLKSLRVEVKKLGVGKSPIN